MKYIFSILILILALCFPFNTSASPEVDEDGNPIIKIDEAPEWSLKLGEGSLGSVDFEGKGYVIHFWASWNPYCEQVQPGLYSIAQQYVEDEIETIAISFWENPKSKPLEVLAKRGIDFRSLIEGDEVAKAFEVSNVPTTVFINDDKEIVARVTTSDPNDPAIRIAYEKLKDSL